MTSLGERIRKLRKKQKLSQVELAEKINVSKSQMIRYELKGVQPPADTLNKLAEIFNTLVDFLINDNTDENPRATLHDTELLQRFKEVEKLPRGERSIILEVLGTYLRDFRTKQAYVF